MKEFWNERFEKKEFIYGLEPNAFLKKELNALPKKGRALFPLEGEGRNACYAAEQGWDVTAFDFSEAGKSKALGLCKSKEVNITYSLSRLEDFHFTENTYDLVVLIYAHVKPDLRTLFHEKVVKSLKPGGRLILEAFHQKQLEETYTSGGPKNLDMLYTSDILEKDFIELSKKESQDLEIDLSEGAYHLGKAYVTRFIGVK